ncbi:LAQU0S19e01486g1_1 [Lachancea quebecensis]|uniref:LAQU0S19e01486g1_1 n=1 Tax=Lachancea quebecensis TaxID=1654605 RepID=A0A0P1KXE7_9SACH|nr:LAQU0S19e01486g1_1 [Lachancea quebecensis]
MSFFYQNSVIMCIQRVCRRPGDAAMWLFTGLVVVGTLYTMIAPVDYRRRPRRK